MSQSNNWKYATVALLGTVLVLSVVVGVLGVLYYQSTLHAHGQIKTVACAAYADANGTQPITDIDWGILTPNSVLNVTIYLKNTGNAPVNWTMTTQNWNPTNASTYISTTADFKGAINTPPNAIIPCVLTETIATNITGITTYSYDILITASG
jgi:hypothetical protein